MENLRIQPKDFDVIVSLIDNYVKLHSLFVYSCFGSRHFSEGFYLGSPVLPPPQKSTLLNANSIWKQWMKSHSVDILRQIPIYFIFCLFLMGKVVLPKRVSVRDNLSKGKMDKGGLRLRDWSSRCFSLIKRNSTHSCIYIHAFSFLFAEQIKWTSNP